MHFNLHFISNCRQGKTFYVSVFHLITIFYFISAFYLMIFNSFNFSQQQWHNSLNENENFKRYSQFYLEWYPALLQGYNTLFFFFYSSFWFPPGFKSSRLSHVSSYKCLQHFTELHSKHTSHKQKGDSLTCHFITVAVCHFSRGCVSK